MYSMNRMHTMNSMNRRLRLMSNSDQYTMRSAKTIPTRTSTANTIIINFFRVASNLASLNSVLPLFFFFFLARLVLLTALMGFFSILALMTATVLDFSSVLDFTAGLSMKD